MFKIYPLQFLLAAVGIGATGAGVNRVLKITDGKFQLKKLAYVGYDANGVIVPNVNITITCKKAGFNLFADSTALASLQRGDQPTFELPNPLDLLQNDELNFTATGQSGNTVTTLNISLIGDETK